MDIELTSLSKALQDPLNVKTVERLLGAMRKANLEANTVTLNAALGLYAAEMEREE